MYSEYFKWPKNLLKRQTFTNELGFTPPIATFKY